MIPDRLSALFFLASASVLAQAPAAFLRGALHTEGGAADSVRTVDLGSTYSQILDPQFQEKLRLRARAACAAGGAPQGFLLVNPPAWDTAALPALRRLGPDHPAKQAYVDFLKERYAYHIGRLNEAYAIDSTSFTDLGAFDFARLDAARPAVRADDAAFLDWIAEILYRTAAEELRQCAPSRRIFGSPPPAAAKYVDGMWLETSHDASPDAAVAAAIGRLHRLTGRPVLVGDHRPGPPLDLAGLGPALAGYLRCARNPSR